MSDDLENPPWLAEVEDYVAVAKPAKRKRASVDQLHRFEKRRISAMGHLIHKLKAKDSTGRWAFYFVLVRSEMEKEFMSAIDDDGMIDLESYGQVIASCYGDEPDDNTRRFLYEKYGFSV